MLRMGDTETLQLAAENGIIDIEMCKEKVTAMQNEKLLNKHCYNIWKGEDDYWKTYLPDDSKKNKRRMIKRKQKVDLEKIIIEFYRENSNNPTFKEIFKCWIDEKVECKEICQGTVTKYENDYKRFCSGKEIENVKFKNLTENELRKFIKKTIADMNLTAKAYSGLRLILQGMLRYAKWNGFTSISAEYFFKDINIGKNTFKKKIKNKEMEVFTNEEAYRISSYVRGNVSIRNLGVLLAFQTGIRVGELASLKYRDINFEKKELHIQRTEITYRNPETGKSVNEVREYPKNENADRYVILTDNTIDTLRSIVKINGFTEYLFEENGKRIRENAFNRKLARICKDLSMPQRSMHKIRKTYGTCLLDNYVDESIIKEQMGHSDIRTTRQFYYYCNRDEEERRKQISRAISI